MEAQPRGCELVVADEFTQHLNVTFVLLDRRRHAAPTPAGFHLPPVSAEDCTRALKGLFVGCWRHHAKDRAFRDRAGREAMALGTGGRMKQEIYRDRRPFSDCDQSPTSRCFVHLRNALIWREIAGSLPPQPPLTAAEYRQRCLPWFDYYADDLKALPGSDRLTGVKSVGEFGQAKGEAPLAGEEPIKPKELVSIGPAYRPQPGARVIRRMSGTQLTASRKGGSCRPVLSEQGAQGTRRMFSFVHGAPRPRRTAASG